MKRNKKVEYKKTSDWAKNTLTVTNTLAYSIRKKVYRIVTAAKFIYFLSFLSILLDRLYRHWSPLGCPDTRHNDIRYNDAQNSNKNVTLRIKYAQYLI